MMIEPFFKWVDLNKCSVCPSSITFNSVIHSYIKYVRSQVFNNDDFEYYSYVQFDNDAFGSNLYQCLGDWIKDATNDRVARVMYKPSAHLVINTILNGDQDDLQSRITRLSNAVICLDDSLQIMLPSSSSNRDVYTYYMAQSALNEIQELLPHANEYVLGDILVLLKDQQVH